MSISSRYTKVIEEARQRGDLPVLIAHMAACHACRNSAKVVNRTEQRYKCSEKEYIKYLKRIAEGEREGDNYEAFGELTAWNMSMFAEMTRLVSNGDTTAINANEIRKGANKLIKALTTDLIVKVVLVRRDVPALV